MKTALAAAVLLTAAIGHPVPAAAQHGPGRGIPAQFHGRWAENVRACVPTHFTTAITITRDGWSSFEEGGEVTRVGQVRGTTHYFRMSNSANGETTTGSLALRRIGPRLGITFHDDTDQPVHAVLIRCR